MPELPEVETVVRELHKKLAGRTIDTVDVRSFKLVAVGPEGLGSKRVGSKSIATRFAKTLQGAQVVAVRRRAKLLIFELSGSHTLFVHLKMTGQFIFEDPALRAKTGSKYRILNKLSAPLVQLPSKHTHVVFQFTDGSTLYFNDMRQFGYLKLVADVDVAQIQELQDYGPEPLDKAFTSEQFVRAVERRAKSPIKLVLMDPVVVVGIGNIYSDEILFCAGVRPERLVSTLSTAELQRIFEAIGPVLRQGIHTKGSSVGDFVRTDGAWGSMGKYHFVYGRKKQACKVCGSMIESMKMGGRTACFCPQCQK